MMMRRIVDRLSSVLRSFSFCFILHLSKDSRSTGVQMISRGQVIVINSGDQVHIECEFEAESFNLFDNPIWWRKTQRHEETQINMMGNLMEPFESTRRFKVAFQSKDTRHRLGLTISNSGLEDSGNYTCEVNGLLNSLLGLVTHYLFIRAPVDDVFLVDNNSTEDFLFHQQRSLTYVEGIPTVFRCVAIGGYPPPEVSIFVGARDVTSQFGLSFSTQMSGVRGLRIMHYTTERWSSGFTAQAHDDSTLASCSVVVSGLASRTRTAKLEVYHAPVITCQSSWAHVGERNVFIRCSVKARPKVSTIFWIIDSNNTTVSEGQVVQEHWTLIMEQSGSQVDANLYIRQAKPEHFRKYTLFAENMIAGKSRDTHLLLKLQTPTIKELNLTRKVLTYSSNFDSHSSGVKEQLFVSKNTAAKNLDFKRMVYFIAHLFSLLVCYSMSFNLTSEIR